MDKITKPTQTIDAYIQSFPTPTQAVLKAIRKLIRTLAPKAVGSISYGVPAYKLDGRPLVYFAGFKKHVSLYPVSDGMVKAIKELTPFRTGRGTVQFLLDKPLPVSLVKKFVQYKLREHKVQSKMNS